MYPNLYPTLSHCFPKYSNLTIGLSCIFLFLSLPYLGGQVTCPQTYPHIPSPYDEDDILINKKRTGIYYYTKDDAWLSVPAPLHEAQKINLYPSYCQMARPIWLDLDRVTDQQTHPIHQTG